MGKMKTASYAVALVACVLLAGCQSVDAKRRKEISDAWGQWVDVEFEVVGYEKGEPDSYLVMDLGIRGRMYPSNVAKVKALSPSEFEGQIYDLSLPDDPVGDFDPARWRTVGEKMKVRLPLVHLKYRPWGFIPFDELREPIQPPETMPLSARPEGSPFPAACLI